MHLKGDNCETKILWYIYIFQVAQDFYGQSSMVTVVAPACVFRTTTPSDSVFYCCCVIEH